MLRASHDATTTTTTTSNIKHDENDDDDDDDDEDVILDAYSFVDGDNHDGIVSIHIYWR